MKNLLKRLTNITNTISSTRKDGENSFLQVHDGVVVGRIEFFTDNETNPFIRPEYPENKRVIEVDVAFQKGDSIYFDNIRLVPVAEDGTFKEDLFLEYIRENTQTNRF